jgi:hypothetical protein
MSHAFDQADQQVLDEWVLLEKEPDHATKIKPETCAQVVHNARILALKPRLLQYSMGWINARSALQVDCSLRNLGSAGPDPSPNQSGGGP